MSLHLNVGDYPEETYADEALERALKRFKDAVEAGEDTYICLEYAAPMKGAST